MSWEGSIIWFLLFLGLVWLVGLVVALSHLARRTDMALTVKVLWVIVIFMAPFLGLIAYWVLGKKTGRREV